MASRLLWTGGIAGIVGLAISARAAYKRLNGAFLTGGLQIGTLPLGGITGMQIACLCLLLMLKERSRR